MIGSRESKNQKKGGQTLKDNLRTVFSKRQYMLSKDYEIYYYSDRNMKQVENHKHDYYEFYFFLEGDMSINIEGKAYPLKPGDVVLIPPGVHHYAKVHNQDIPYRRFVFWISKSYCNGLMEISTVYGYLLQHVSISKEYIFHNNEITFNTIQSKIIQLIEETQRKHFAWEEKVTLGVNDLLILLNRIVYEKNHAKSNTKEKSLYQNLIYYIESHLDEELSLEQIAKVFYVSKYHIAHVFKENIGISVHQYITKKRLTICKEAIESGMSIKEAFLMSGFKEYSSFFRAFKKEYGISPNNSKSTIKNSLSGIQNEST
jgi:AraC-like DNA-binding protein/mannose-6-phosphate isomerase-like protein (cupin superfamily)